MTIEDIKLIIQAFYKVNDIERKAHGEQGAYEYSLTEGYWERILEQYIYLKYQQFEVEEKKFWEKKAIEAHEAAKDSPSMADYDKSKLLEKAMKDFVEMQEKALIELIRAESKIKQQLKEK